MRDYAKVTANPPGCAPPPAVKEACFRQPCRSRRAVTARNSEERDSENKTAALFACCLCVSYMFQRFSLRSVSAWRGGSPYLFLTDQILSPPPTPLHRRPVVASERTLAWPWPVHFHRRPQVVKRGWETKSCEKAFCPPQPMITPETCRR